MGSLPALLYVVIYWRDVRVEGDMIGNFLHWQYIQCKMGTKHHVCKLHHHLMPPIAESNISIICIQYLICVPYYILELG